MSEPTYRITTERSAAAINPWEARAVRLTDGEPVATGYGTTEGEALLNCTGQLRGLAEGKPGDGNVYFYDEDGNKTDEVPPIEPQSIRA